MPSTPSCGCASSAGLPQEMVDVVIDHVASDTRTLKKLGQVCRAWYPRTRRHLFQEIVFHPGRSDRYFAGLGDLIEKNPLLERCIERLGVEFQWDADPSWLNNTFIISLLPLLTSLKKVSIHGPLFHFLKWPTLHPAVQIAFHKLFAQPRVVSLALDRVFDIDIAAFSQFHHLEELTLRNVRLTDGRPSQSGACFPLQPSSQLETPTGSLRSLSATDSGAFLAEALFVCTASSGATFNFRNITQLDLRFQEFDKDFPSTCGSLIKACGPSLETYKASFRRGPLNHASVSSALQLRRFPHLASFTLVVDNTSHVGLNGCEIIRTILVPELDLLPGSGSQSFLNSIHLNINTLDIGKVGVSDKKDLYGFCSEEVWSRLDEILARPEFPFLRELSILFDVCMEELLRQDLVDVKELVLARMPNLQERGIVTVSTRETTLSMY